MDTLLEILEYKRPYGSPEEEDMIKTHIDSVEGMQSDKFGNRFIKVGEKSETIFSSHTDTVHAKGGKQELVVDTEMEYIFKDDNECLGADDGAGIWIMLEMIAAKIPGLYIFHRGEECGGLGSNYIATDTPELVKGYKRAIAFDRKGTDDIITRQSGGKCCSDEFAKDFAAQLKQADASLDFKGSTFGSFTDTANYTDLIEECTNLSVGYYSQHTAKEQQDYGFLIRLKNALLQVDFEKLVTKRTKGDNGYLYGYGQNQFSRPYGGYPDNGRSIWDDDWDVPLETPQRQVDKTASWIDIQSFVLNNPSAAADILHEYGVSIQEIKTATDTYKYLQTF